MIGVYGLNRQDKCDSDYKTEQKAYITLLLIRIQELRVTEIELTGRVQWQDTASL